MDLTQYSHIYQAVLLTGCYSVYFASSWRKAKCELAAKKERDRAVTDDVSAIRNDQNSRIADMSSAIIQLKINLDILMDDFHSNRVQCLGDINEIRDEIER